MLIKSHVILIIIITLNSAKYPMQLQKELVFLIVSENRAKLYVRESESFV